MTKLSSAVLALMLVFVANDVRAHTEIYHPDPT